MNIRIKFQTNSYLKQLLRLWSENQKFSAKFFFFQLRYFVFTIRLFIHEANEMHINGCPRY